MSANEQYVLIVDDQILMRRLAGEVLKSQGFQVLLADSGQECLNLHKQHGKQIGCVLLDINMPDMDGYETFDALRATDPDIGVIFCTSYDVARERISNVLLNDQVSFLRKPYTMKGLVQQISIMMTNQTAVEA
ncbi:MAG: response regulator [Chloroflexota bacterium]